ncbi:hypothetical protein CPLU01_12789 [Colletotrichum plurivorum]|uniref:Uncharacterized protein n=1 Tax=Colletotrichum plurivorum TaxID=2175906 RepID=A0A8H6N5L0_9PEZI|nr:hypothetical protein CPLU01_12789 [Colletotrichum plurivorum]
MGPNATPTLRVSSRRLFPSQPGPATYWRESGERRESRRPAPPSGVRVATSEDDENHDAIEHTPPSQWDPRVEEVAIMRVSGTGDGRPFGEGTSPGVGMDRASKIREVVGDCRRLRSAPVSDKPPHAFCECKEALETKGWGRREWSAPVGPMSDLKAQIMAFGGCKLDFWLHSSTAIHRTQLRLAKAVSLDSSSKPSRAVGDDLDVDGS